MTKRREAWTLPASARRSVLAHARASGPEECCGVLVGKGRRVAFAIPMRNAAADPRRCYRFDDAEHIGIRQWLRRGAPALRIVGVYHSHPRSAAWPSPTDRAEANYPEWLYVIAGRTRVRFAVRGFRIRSRAAQEVSLRPDPERPRPTR